MPATKTLFPWPGGKTRLLPHLLPLIEATAHNCYVEGSYCPRSDDMAR